MTKEEYMELHNKLWSNLEFIEQRDEIQPLDFFLTNGVQKQAKEQYEEALILQLSEISNNSESELVKYFLNGQEMSNDAAYNIVRKALESFAK